MSTIIVGLIVVAIVGASIFKIIKDKKNGRGCCGSCCNCNKKC